MVAGRHLITGTGETRLRQQVLTFVFALVDVPFFIFKIGRNDAFAGVFSPANVRNLHCKDMNIYFYQFVGEKTPTKA